MEIKSESKKEKSKRCKLFRQKTNKLDKQVANLINIYFYLVMPPAPSGSIIEHISQLFREVALFSTVMCSQPIYINTGYLRQYTLTNFFLELLVSLSLFLSLFLSMYLYLYLTSQFNRKYCPLFRNILGGVWHDPGL